MAYQTIRQTTEQNKAMLDKASAVQFCRLAQNGATFENIIYKSGLRMVRATLGNHKVEVTLFSAKQLRADGWRIRAN